MKNFIYVTRCDIWVMWAVQWPVKIDVGKIRIFSYNQREKWNDHSGPAGKRRQTKTNVIFIKRFNKNSWEFHTVQWKCLQIPNVLKLSGKQNAFVLRKTAMGRQLASDANSRGVDDSGLALVILETFQVAASISAAGRACGWVTAYYQKASGI